MEERFEAANDPEIKEQQSSMIQEQPQSPETSHLSNPLAPDEHLGTEQAENMHGGRSQAMKGFVDFCTASWRMGQDQAVWNIGATEELARWLIDQQAAMLRWTDTTPLEPLVRTQTTLARSALVAWTTLARGLCQQMMKPSASSQGGAETAGS
jgi:hypothetical protein